MPPLGEHMSVGGCLVEITPEMYSARTGMARERVGIRIGQQGSCNVATPYRKSSRRRAWRLSRLSVAAIAALRMSEFEK